MSIVKRYLNKTDADGRTLKGADGKPVPDESKPRYLVRVAAMDPLTGKRRNKTVGTYRTKKEAEKAERDALTAQERGTLVDPSKLTVAELLASWLQTKSGSISTNSEHDYATAIRVHIVPAIGRERIQKLTPAGMQAQVTAWKDAGVSPRMIHRVHSILNQALGQAMDWGIVYRNVMATVKRPSLPKRPATVWSVEEVRTFLHASLNRPVLVRGGSTGKTRPDELTPLWHFLVLEGMRRGEALGLRWQDVNWDARLDSSGKPVTTVHISQTVIVDKSGKRQALIQPRAKTSAGARTVQLTADTLKVLKEHRDRQAFTRRAAGDSWQDHDLIICTATGSPINPNNIYRSYSRLAMQANVPEIRIHDLRHTAATMLLRAGVPAKVVSERLGHATIGITLDTYSHVLPDMQDVAAEAMSRLLAGPVEPDAGTGTA